RIEPFYGSRDLDAVDCRVSRMEIGIVHALDLVVLGPAVGPVRSRSVVAPHRSRLFTDLVCSPKQATRITIEAVWPIQNKKLRTPDEESSACGEGSTPLAKAEQIRAFRVPFPRLSARLEGA